MGSPTNTRASSGSPSPPSVALDEPVVGGVLHRGERASGPGRSRRSRGPSRTCSAIPSGSPRRCAGPRAPCAESSRGLGAAEVACADGRRYRGGVRAAPRPRDPRGSRWRRRRATRSCAPSSCSRAEDEAFEDLGGEVYTRAVLRTYAEYLGLRSDKVLAAYGRHAEDPEPPSPPPPQGPIEKAMAATRIRDNQRFLLIVAVVVLAALIGVGFVSRRGGPAVAAIPTTTTAATGGTEDAVAPTVEVVDRRAERRPPRRDGRRGAEGRRWSCARGRWRPTRGSPRCILAADDGGAFWLTVDGEQRGAPGEGRTAVGGDLRGTGGGAIGVTGGPRPEPFGLGWPNVDLDRPAPAPARSSSCSCCGRPTPADVAAAVRVRGRGVHRPARRVPRAALRPTHGARAPGSIRSRTRSTWSSRRSRCRCSAGSRGGSTIVFAVARGRRDVAALAPRPAGPRLDAGVGAGEARRPCRSCWRSAVRCCRCPDGSRSSRRG